MQSVDHALASRSCDKMGEHQIPPDRCPHGKPVAPAEKRHLASGTAVTAPSIAGSLHCEDGGNGEGAPEATARNSDASAPPDRFGSRPRLVSGTTLPTSDGFNAAPTTGHRASCRFRRSADVEVVGEASLTFCTCSPVSVP